MPIALCSIGTSHYIALKLSPDDLMFIISYFSYDNQRFQSDTIEAENVILCDLSFTDKNLCKPTEARTILPAFKHNLQRENVTCSAI